MKRREILLSTASTVSATGLLSGRNYTINKPDGLDDSQFRNLSLRLLWGTKDPNQYFGGDTITFIGNGANHHKIKNYLESTWGNLVNRICDLNNLFGDITVDNLQDLLDTKIKEINSINNIETISRRRDSEFNEHLKSKIDFSEKILSDFFDKEKMNSITNKLGGSKELEGFSDTLEDASTDLRYTGLRFILRTIEPLIEFINNKTTFSLPESISEWSKLIDSNIRNISSFIPVIYSLYRCLDSVCTFNEIRQTSTKDRIKSNAFADVLISFGILAIDLLLTAAPVGLTYRLSWITTRGAANNGLVYLRGLLGNTLYSQLLRTVHWASRSVYGYTGTTAREFSIQKTRESLQSSEFNVNLEIQMIKSYDWLSNPNSVPNYLDMNKFKAIHEKDKLMNSM